MPISKKPAGESQKAEEKKSTKTVKKTVAKKAVATKAAAEPKASKAAAKTKIDPILHKLLEAGAHFGHQSSRWNPKMAKYIYTTRGGVHIIDLTQTAEQLAIAKKFVEDTTKNGGKILFVSTKRQAKAAVQEAAKSANMPYVTYRWLGGMLTNLETIQKRVLRLKKLRTQQEETSFAGMSKKDRAGLERELELLERTFSGIADMEVVPSAVYVVDMPREHTAILEARKLGIPVLAICDTNADPDDVDYPIPANDDAISAISLITSEIGAAAASGAAIHATKVAKETPVNQGEDKWMTLSVEDIKKLRDSTGAGMMDAKGALEEAGGDMAKAQEILRVKGIAKAEKKSDREASAGVVEAYVHGGKIGVLVEINSETDFVARTDDFKGFAHDIAMHIAAANPLYLDRESVPAEVVDKEKQLITDELTESGKPAEHLDKIVEGKLSKFYGEVCLMDQTFVKDPDLTIEQLRTNLVAKIGENIVIRRFNRMELAGE